jgi:tetratricopeptide (TPR) repeat protein
MTPQETKAALETAVSRLRGGRYHDAVALLQQVVAAAPKVGEAHRLLGMGRKALRDYAGAEQSLGEAVALDRKDAEALCALADVQRLLGKDEAAEKSFRAALVIDRRHVSAARGLGQLLLWYGRTTEALQVTTPLYAGATDGGLISQHGAALKADGRVAESLAAYERAAVAAPGGVADHNIAAALADRTRFPEAQAATRSAFAKGLRAPETWLVHAHALQGQDKLDEAEAAYHEALRARPAFVDAHRDLAQLIWMRTEDPVAAIATLDRAIGATLSPELHVVRAKLLSDAGRERQAYETLTAAIQLQPADGNLQLAASQQAVKAGLYSAALDHARLGAAALPGEFHSEATLCEVYLANGRAEEAAAIAQTLRAQKPEHQHAIALQATAWRLLGDPRYGELYDYAAFVHGYRLDTPEGWPTLEAYLADLAEGLRAMHVTRTHPVGQSLRHGSQTNQSLLHSEQPAVKAFTQAIDGPVRRHIAAIGQDVGGKGKDPLRARNRGGYSIAGIWSVQLRPGGFHINHVHPEGWLSSACYIEVPRAVEGEGRQGWIQFGKPGIATQPVLEAEHFIKPEPGLLVLFPSYMWHGTVPFEGDEPRLSMAFDLAPGKR